MPGFQTVIGIDGGGTKTALIAASLSGDILLELEGGPSNFQVIGTKRAARAIISLVKKALAQIREHPVSVVAFLCGLTGAGRKHDRERIGEAILAESKKQSVSLPSVWIESDAMIALEGAFKGGSGIIVIAGTGSIVYGKDEHGVLYRVGGWGRLIGDEGGGFAVGRDALRAMARMLDGRGESTEIAKLFANEMNLKNEQDIVSFLYEEKKDPAVLAPLVVKAAAEGDRIAQRILSLQAQELVEHVGALLRKMKIRRRIPLALIGSMVRDGQQYARLVRTKIAKTFPQVIVQDPAAPPAYGAVLLALKRLKPQTAS